MLVLLSIQPIYLIYSFIKKLKKSDRVLSIFLENDDCTQQQFDDVFKLAILVNEKDQYNSRWGGYIGRNLLLPLLTHPLFKENHFKELINIIHMEKIGYLKYYHNQWFEKYKDTILIRFDNYKKDPSFLGFECKDLNQLISQTTPNKCTYQRPSVRLEKLIRDHNKVKDFLNQNIALGATSNNDVVRKLYTIIYHSNQCTAEKEQEDENRTTNN